MINIKDFNKLEVRRGNAPKEKVLEIVIAKGKAKYMRLTPFFLETYNLQNKVSVDIFVKKENKISLIIFKFRDDDKGTLKLSKDKIRGIGYISATSLFKELGIDNNTMKETHFTPKEDTDGKEKVYIIEIPKN